MACTGCLLTAVFAKDPSYQGQNPILDPCGFDPQPGANPDGGCSGTPCAQTTPCAPIGGIGFTSCYVNHMHLRFYNCIDGQWDTATLKSGFSWVILVFNLTLACDSTRLMAELFETDQTTPLGKIELKCSKCEEVAPPGG